MTAAGGKAGSRGNSDPSTHDPEFDSLCPGSACCLRPPPKTCPWRLVWTTGVTLLHNRTPQIHTCSPPSAWTRLIRGRASPAAAWVSMSSTALSMSGSRPPDMNTLRTVCRHSSSRGPSFFGRAHRRMDTACLWAMGIGAGAAWTSPAAGRAGAVEECICEDTWYRRMHMASDRNLFCREGAVEGPNRGLKGMLRHFNVKGKQRESMHSLGSQARQTRSPTAVLCHHHSCLMVFEGPRSDPWGNGERRGGGSQPVTPQNDCHLRQIILREMCGVKKNLFWGGAPSTEFASGAFVNGPSRLPRATRCGRRP